MMPRTIYLAGGCFWGVEKYISLIPGVTATETGYANGRTLHPTYEEVCRSNTGHAETVKVTYDAELIELSELLERFYEIIDPTAVNRQGPDRGTQYRTGIYYTDPDDEAVIRESIDRLQRTYDKPLAVEVNALNNYQTAELYHQKYLDTNPGGYCHIPGPMFDLARRPIARKTVPRYQKKSPEQLEQILTPIQYHVTQENGTERPFENEYHNKFDQGIYVDITTGEPLFVSTDKFESGCGWPSFSKPIDKGVIKEKNDRSHGMVRTEVRSNAGDAHLGHVFSDGPRERGGLRYCINSAALRFVPVEQMEAEGYSEYLALF